MNTDLPPGEPDRLAALRATYDRVADEYVRRVAGELAHKPFDRSLLDEFAIDVRGTGPVADLGCGPGHVTAYLAARDVEVVGIDLSPVLIDRARALHPALEFCVGDFTALEVRDAAWAGAVAFYSLIHVPPAELGAALREVRRVLRAGAPLLVGFHVGSEVRHLDEWWGYPADADFYFFEQPEMEGALTRAGFTVMRWNDREPYPDVEAQTQRGYILARAT